MNEKQFDNVIKDIIGQYESAVSPGMWHKVSPQRKKRRRLLLWWLLPGAALIVGLYFLGAFEKQVNHDVKQLSVSENKNGVPQRTDTLQAPKIEHPIASENLTTNNHVIKETSTSTTKSIKLPSQAASGSHIVKRWEPVLTDNSKHNYREANAGYSRPMLHTVSSYQKPFIDLKVYYSDTTALPSPAQAMKKINPWFAEVYTGPAVAIKSIEDNFFSSPDEYSRLSISSGILIGKHLSKRFYLKSGLTYTSIREKFKQDSVTFSALNLYNSFDVPIIAGYALSNQKLKINLQAGLLFNFYSWRKDFYRTQLYKKSGWRAQASVNMLYPVGKNIQVMVEPYYIRQLSNMVTVNSFDLKMQQMGLSLGVHYTIPSRQRH